MWPLLQGKSADSETLFTGTDVAFSSPGCCVLSERGLSGAPASSRDRGSPSHPVPWAWVDTSLILLSRGLLGGSWWPVWWITHSSPFFTRSSPPLPPHHLFFPAPSESAALMRQEELSHAWCSGCVCGCEDSTVATAAGHP